MTNRKYGKNISRIMIEYTLCIFKENGADT